MKLQPASVKEVRRMSVGCIICALLEAAAFTILNMSGVTSVSPVSLIVSITFGTLIAIGNFTLLCIMVQQAAAVSEEKHRRSLVRGSYNLRILLQAIWIVIAFIFPFFSLLASVVPLLFPTIVIYYLQIRGQLFDTNASGSQSKQSRTDDSEDTAEENLGPFET